MKKLFFSLVMAIVAVTATYAQSSLIATLSHEGEVQVFHGPKSLKEAMAAAADGDVISLAGGIYEATDITKGITLRGSGVEKDTISNAYPTEIQGLFQINIPDSCSSLIMEGVYCTSRVTYTNIKNPTFEKCRFYEIDYYNSASGSKIDNLTLLHCNVTYRLNLTSSSTATLINSRINRLSGSSLDITNCVLTTCTGSYITKSQLRNCIIGSAGSSNSYYFDDTNMIYNCVGYNYSNIFSAHSSLNGNKTVGSYGDLLASTGFYVLTDEAKEKYKGDDGTEVGLYGGSLPYDIRVAKPQITKCNIAQKTTADGKLSVDIEVKGIE